MNKIIKITFFTLITAFIVSGQVFSIDNNFDKNIKIEKSLDKYFNNCGVKGNITIFDYKNNKWITNDLSEAKKEELPASTFKVINLLIALETKVIKDENETIKWVGKTDHDLYGYRPEIYKDMTVKEAFKVSAGWAFIELAKKVGKKNYSIYLKKAKYGNQNLSQKEDDFWNFGDFAISSVNQINFLKDVYEAKAPFSKRNINILKNVMITEKSKEYTLRSKTGWTRDKNINTGWWVGYFELKDNLIFFSTRLSQDRKFKRDDFGECRKQITMSVLKELKIIDRSDN